MCQGTDQSETILGLQDNDVLSGHGGDDIIEGNQGDDKILGNAGDDVLQGNLGDDKILVNVSVGSKIQAIASMMACMMFKDMATIKPYYVVPEKYNTILLEEKRNQETEGMRDIITLPEYKIEIPNEKLIECMHMISQHKENKITKRELKDLALNKSLIQVGKKETLDREGSSDQAAYMALNKNLIEPLLDWKFISVEKIGSRHIVSLTNEGINALRFLHESK
ncbi:MAG TPA: DUF6293 family protein [Nitrososphaeraceae archaeon]|nr:DUF6293 family protein [Nitrososphaeraceae archaeon]